MQATSEHASRWRDQYHRWWLFMPGVVFASSFGGLCAYECMGAPWFVLLVTPAAVAAIGIVLFIVYWRFSGRLPEADRVAMRRYLGWSLLWAPPLAVLSVLIALGILQLATMLYAIARS